MKEVVRPERKRRKLRLEAAAAALAAGITATPLDEVNAESTTANGKNAVQVSEAASSAVRTTEDMSRELGLAALHQYLKEAQKGPAVNEKDGWLLRVKIPLNPTLEERRAFAEDILGAGVDKQSPIATAADAYTKNSDASKENTLWGDLTDSISSKQWELLGR